VRNFIAPKIKKIPPRKIIHFSMFNRNWGTFIKSSPILRKYIPKNKYRIKNNNPPPPLAMIK